MTSRLSRRNFLTVSTGAAAVAALAFVSDRPDASSQTQGDGTPTADGSPMAMPGGGAGAAYLQIANAGTEDDVLVSGSTDVANVVEIHEMKMNGDVMMMAPLADGLVIPAGGSVSLEPGGYHVMLIGLLRDLKAGETYELTLEFSNAGQVTVTVPIYATEGSFEDANQNSPAEPVTAGDLTLSGIWTRMAPMLVESSPAADSSPMAMHGGGAGAAFMQIANAGTEDDVLVSGSTDVANVVEIHEMKMNGDVMMMAPLADGLVIPAGGSVSLEPGGYHVMLIGLLRDLKAGETYELTLEFSTAGKVTVTVPIYATKKSFEDANQDSPAEPATVGDLTLSGIWTRMAPMLVESTPMAMPGSSPEATPDM